MTEYSYEYWQARQRGETPPIHDGIAHPGFYRTRAKPPKGQKYRDQPWLPVAIFEHEGALVAVVGEDLTDPASIWLHCCENDVSEEAYRQAKQTGQWDDVEPAAVPIVSPVKWVSVEEAREIYPAPPPMGHNSPPDPAEQMSDQIASAKSSLDAYATIESDEAAARAQSLRSRLLELAREADKQREDEKRPHFEAAKAVDARWMKLVKSAKAGADALATALGDFFTKKDRAAKEEERKAQEAADKAAASGKPAAPSYAAPAPQPTTVKGGYGRAAAIKVVKVVTAVSDWDALFGFLRDHPELRDCMTKLAQRAIDKGHTVPGVTVEERQKVA
jgi:hypothetical protein